LALEYHSGIEMHKSLRSILLHVDRCLTQILKKGYFIFVILMHSISERSNGKCTNDPGGYKWKLQIH